jgi:hypothetical protein
MKYIHTIVEIRIVNRLVSPLTFILLLAFFVLLNDVHLELQRCAS